eukprot:c4569_g1_i1.p1 GENE.c4569_g1_i1~~c4569_g1_i1.p1  ORF type:complete len:514 (-),score=117.01 c4569_g1_i1:550-2091(-)
MFLQGLRGTKLMNIFNTFVGVEGETEREQDQLLMQKSWHSSPTCDSRSLMFSAILIIFLIAISGLLLQQLKFTDNESRKLFDYDRFPVAVQQWEEWDGRLVLKQSLSDDNHYVSKRVLRQVIKSHLAERGLTISLKETDEIISLLPAESQVGSRETVEQIFALIRPSSQMESILSGIRWDQFTGPALFDMIGKGVWKQWSPQCTGSNVQVAPAGATAFFQQVMKVCEIDPSRTFNKQNLDKFEQLDAQLNRLVEIGESSESVATADVMNNAAIAVELDPRLLGSVKYLYIQHSFVRVIPNPRDTSNVAGHYATWDTIRCVFSIVTFAKELIAKSLAKQDKQTAFPDTFYERPSSMVKTPFVTPLFDWRANTHTDHNPRVVALIVLVMLVLIGVTAKISVFSPNATVAEECQQSNYEVPSLTSNVTSTSITLSWAPMLACRQDMTDVLVLTELDNKVSYVEIHLPSNATSTEFTGLTPATQYQFAFLAKLKQESEIRQGLRLVVITAPPDATRV